MTSMCAVHQLREIFPAVRKFPQVVDYGDEALELARAIGWRAREAFAQVSRSNLFTAGGDYVRAVAAGQEGLALAEQIGHRQWLCSANWTMGCILLDLFDLAGARRHLEEGLTLAEATRSQLWLEFVVGILAHILVLQGELEQAGAVLQRCYQSDERPVSAGARMVWRAAAEHALACGEAARALALVDQLLAYTIEDDGFAPEMPVGLHVLRGNVLAALGRTGEAETELQEARQTAVQYYAPNSQWRVHAALARLYTAQGEQEQAAHHSAAAQNLLAGLAPNVPPELKEQFARGVRSLSV
jgi:tetratricopeptide (TPR) repeat protein